MLEMMCARRPLRVMIIVLLALCYWVPVLCSGPNFFHELSREAWADDGPQPFQAILPLAAYEMIQKNKGNPDFVLIDIRTPEEFMAGHIEGAVNIDYHNHDFIERLDSLDKGKTYLIYCRTGRRSSDTLRIMRRLQFKRVYRILGEIVRWRAEGLPLVQ